MYIILAENNSGSNIMNIKESCSSFINIHLRSCGPGMNWANVPELETAESWITITVTPALTQDKKQNDNNENIQPYIYTTVIILPYCFISNRDGLIIRLANYCIRYYYNWLLVCFVLFCFANWIDCFIGRLPHTAATTYYCCSKKIRKWPEVISNLVPKLVQGCHGF